MKIRLMGLVAAVFALAAIPAISQASHGNGNAKSHAHSCKQLKLGFTVRGLLDVPPEFASATKTADDISLSEVTSANRHARRSGEVVKGQGYDVNNDPEGFKVKLVGYTKKRCAPEGTSLEDRYAEHPNLRKVVIKDATPEPDTD